MLQLTLNINGLRIHCLIVQPRGHLTQHKDHHLNDLEVGQAATVLAQSIQNGLIVLHTVWVSLTAPACC